MCITDCCTAHYTRVISPLWCSAFHNTMLHSEPKSLLSCNEQSSIELCSIALPRRRILPTGIPAMPPRLLPTPQRWCCNISWLMAWKGVAWLGEVFDAPWFWLIKVSGMKVRSSYCTKNSYSVKIVPSTLRPRPRPGVNCLLVLTALEIADMWQLTELLWWSSAC